MKLDRTIVEFRPELEAGEEIEITVDENGEIFSSDHRTFKIIMEIADEVNQLFGPVGLCG